MTTSKIKFAALLMLIASIFVLTSCKKKKNENISADVQSETDNSAMEEETSSLASFADDGGSGAANALRGGWFWIPVCANVTVSDTVPGSYPKIVTIDFGTTGCLCLDQRTRKGQIIITFTGPWKYDSLSIDSAIVDLNNYFVDGVQHKGKRYFIWEDDITLHIIAVNCEAVFSDGSARSWNCNRYRKWISGKGTPNFLDDVFELSGTADGTNRKGRDFTISTRAGNPLVRKLSCRWLVSGILDITPDGLSTRSIDWGNGNCDDIVTVTVDDRTITIHLR